MRRMASKQDNNNLNKNARTKKRDQQSSAILYDDENFGRKSTSEFGVVGN
jgi:hypothetical protein